MTAEQFESGTSDLRPDHGLFSLGRLAEAQAEVADDTDATRGSVLEAIQTKYDEGETA